MAERGCRVCMGLGRTSPGHVCHCCWRMVFRSVMERYREIAIDRERGMRVRKVHGRYEMQTADFMLEVELAARGMNERDAAVWRMVYLQGLPWTVVARRLKLDRGLYWHAVYRVQSYVGRRCYYAGLYRREGRTRMPAAEQALAMAA